MKISKVISFICRGIIFSCLAFMIVSCNKILDVNPKQSIDASIALQSKEGVEAALVSVYARLQSFKQYGRDLIAVSEALSDNIIHTENSSQLVNEAANNRGAHLDNWQTGYYAINEINLILDALTSKSFDEEWKAVIKGQAYFLRALNYHNLMKSYSYDPTAIIPQRNFGGVPLMLKGVGDIGSIDELVRVSIDDVYKQIYSDLDSAELFLSKVNKLNGPHIVNINAVHALYSRVALYNGDWKLTAKKADETIENTQAVFSTNEKYFSDWMQPVHPESIFELRFNENENLGSDRSLRAMFTSRGVFDSDNFMIQGVLAVSPSLYKQYEEEDVRKSLIKPGAGNNSRFNEMYKFISKNGVLNLDNIPIIRLSEIFLNRAEANFHIGGSNIEKALEDLNYIRVRAGLTQVVLDSDALLNEILKQRRLELAFEGHRWFDLKRYGQNVIKEQIHLNFEDYRMLAPIPDREVKADKSLKQNYGY